MGRDDLCDNLPNPEALTIQTQNLNQTTSLSQTQSFSLLQKEDEGGRGPFQKDPLSNNGNGREEEQNEEEKEGNTGGIREEDDEEDIDEEMKEDNEEEEVSEGSSSLICCQCPDTPMTDSSFSETGREHTGMHTEREHIIYTDGNTLALISFTSSIFAFNLSSGFFVGLSGTV